MYLAVKAVCDAKPSVWQRVEAFEDAFTDFCAVIDNLIHLQPVGGVSNPAASGIAMAEAVADKILTTDMDELIQQFEAVDVAFVDDYTLARSMDILDQNIGTEPLLSV